MSKKQIHTSKAPPALGPYSQAVWVDNLLFLSGQIPLNPLGELVGGSIEEQAEQIFANIDAIIKKIEDDPESIEIKRTELTLWKKIKQNR